MTCYNRLQLSNVTLASITGGKAAALTTEDVRVEYYKVSANGYVVFKSGRGQLHSVPVTGGTPVQLTPNNQSISGSKFYLSSDGTNVVYLADQLYSVPVVGGTPSQLNSPDVLVSFNKFDLSTYFAISPDGHSVVFTGKNARGVFHLYVVPITGGEGTQLTGRLASGGNVTWFEITSDSQRVIYEADQIADDQFGVYSVPIGGGEAVDLTSTSKGPQGKFYVSADGQWVVTQDYGSKNIFSVPVVGGT